ncbi:class I SAM-dependent methyltransferase [Legionella sp. W05-934-2]|uniref:class I SAM-dependent methyltransferase n=1 Tax=Legionella sp. W05-934-2 TaxID=1198649 RepID=UPI0034630D06
MSTSYILNTNEKARQRLSLQHQLYVDSSLELLHKAGIEKGMTGLEIGCGAGDMTKELSRLVGNNGNILTIDFSPEQIAYVKKLTHDLTNIRYKVWDVNQISQLDETFDFIYCRMVLHHLSNASHAIGEMKKCLNPGGVVICEEPSIFESAVCYPESKDQQQFVNYVQSCFSQNNKDYKIAFRMEQEFRNVGMQITAHGLYEPLLTTRDEKMIYPMALDDITSQLLDSKLTTKKDVDNLLSNLIELAKSETTLSWIRMHQVVAKVEPL